MFLRISLLGSVNRLLKQILLEGSVLTEVILGTPANSSLGNIHNELAVQSAGSAFCRGAGVLGKRILFTVPCQHFPYAARTNTHYLD